ncbi:MAG: hypothetical protein ACJAWY_001530 [Sphingomonas echinoides]
MSVRPLLERTEASWRIDRSALVIPPHMVVSGRAEQNVSLVGDDEWLLECAIARPAKGHESRIRFYRIADIDERELIREYLFLSLHYEPRDEVRCRLGTLKPGSLMHMSIIARQFLREVRETGLQLHEIDQPWLDHWLSKKRHLTPATLVYKIVGIRRLALYAPLMSFRGLEITPWGNRTATRVAGYRRGGENVTPRVPEAITAPALRWAMFYVDYGIDDIIARRDIAAVDMEARRQRVSPKVSDQRLRAYLDALDTAGSGVPVTPQAQPAWPEICKASGLGVAVLKARSTVIEEAMLRLGTERPGASSRWTSMPGTNVAWRSHLPSFSSRYAFIPGMAACYLVIGLLSGMRGEEVAALRRGCLRLIRDEHARIVRYELVGRIFKGRDNVDGAEHHWTVVEPVARAVSAAIRLQDHLRRVIDAGSSPKDDDPLFMTVQTKGVGNERLTANQSTKYLNYFVKECSKLANEMVAMAPDEAGPITALYHIPDHDGEPWRWQTRQLRRTLAWYIASQPFGVIAGMLQYGHASAIMFEGYAGTSASGFRSEIEEERRLAQLGDIVEMYEDWKAGIDPGGPMRSKLVADFTRIRNKIGDLPGAVVGDRRHAKMLSNTAVTLHPGFINDCFFYADHALCLKVKGADAQPAFTKCQPSRCPNSVVAKRHVPALRSCIADAESMKSGKNVSPIQKHAIEAQLDIYRQLLEQVER